ncbi:hypothetical protein [Streptomyces ochraceiscleroticus]|uniref:PknH-like extracellular domain-containing protein n=1 Tax=Streptomyces ochraceiscleroticus TaxID=47761 RepID=A0ABW1MVE5_9ACTN|nr:hypothetical protein [Streptomyces ochraceiscleroticus]
MSVARKRLAIILATGVLMLAAAVVALSVAGFPPFEKKGTVDSASVCTSLGGGDATPEDVENVLPAAEEYTFEDDDPARSDPSQSTFESSCFVSADGKTALSVRTEMVRAASAGLWAKHSVANNEYVGSRQAKTFDAGESALSGKRFAAVYVPCVSDGKIPGGVRNVSVVARAMSQPSADPEVAERSLKALLLDAARHAHSRAKCDLPSKLPGDS